MFVGGLNVGGIMDTQEKHTKVLDYIVSGDIHPMSCMTQADH